MTSRLVEIVRDLKMHLPKGKSAFLWGPRKTGKTTLLRHYFSNSPYYDLLETDTFLRLSKEPFRLREELNAVEIRYGVPIIIDEVQKIPSLLDEIHSLIEKKKLSFLLCGSSARKLKKTHANMLGGRAWRFELHPFTSHELGKDFDLMRALNQGLVPSHYLSSFPERELKAYLQDYLKEEIQQEALVRNLPSFARFLDAVSFVNGELVNYANIARDCGVDSKTVAEYHRILEDTLIGHFLEPFRKQRKRQIISATPKFYLFDVGVAGALMKRKMKVNQGVEFGKALEHFIFMELVAYRSYREKDFRLSFWRTKDGDEVDFVIDDGRIAIEVKSTKNVDSKDLKGLNLFHQEHRSQKSILICQESVPRKINEHLQVLPIQVFLKKLWSDELIDE
ncbi:MAG: ATP-binding protein [Deltaproteobacteria bacterium]|nr:ATP-binding protein [Deltaproteobacteria bacterium]